MDEKCEDCRFWNRTNTSHGECRWRPPPLPTKGSATDRWPTTTADEWCGQWTARPGVTTVGFEDVRI